MLTRPQPENHKPLLTVRTEKMAVGGMDQVGEEGDHNYTYLHCHHHNDTCIKMGSDESHFNVLLIVRDKVSHSLRQSVSGHKSQP